MEITCVSYAEWMELLRQQLSKTLAKTDGTPHSKSTEVWLNRVKNEDMENAEFLFDIGAATGWRI